MELLVDNKVRMFLGGHSADFGGQAFAVGLDIGSLGLLYDSYFKILHIDKIWSGICMVTQWSEPC